MVVIFSRKGDTRKLFYNDGLLTWEQAVLWKFRRRRRCAAAYTCPDVASTPRRDRRRLGRPLIHQHRWLVRAAEQSVDRDGTGPPQIGVRRGDEAVGHALPHATAAELKRTLDADAQAADAAARRPGVEPRCPPRR